MYKNKFVRFNEVIWLISVKENEGGMYNINTS